jgi:hypothetical protein
VEEQLWAIPAKGREEICQALGRYIAERIPRGIADILNGERLDVSRTEDIIGGRPILAAAAF